MRLRRHLSSKDFKGSIFVEFADKPTADKVCSMVTMLAERHACVHCLVSTQPMHNEKLSQLAASSSLSHVPTCKVFKAMPVLQVLVHSIEHAGAPLKLEAKNDYMKRKVEERGLAPNSILNGTEQVVHLLPASTACSKQAWFHPPLLLLAADLFSAMLT